MKTTPATPAAHSAQPYPDDTYVRALEDKLAQSGRVNVRSILLAACIGVFVGAAVVEVGNLRAFNAADDVWGAAVDHAVAVDKKHQIFLDRCLAQLKEACADGHCSGADKVDNRYRGGLRRSMTR